VFATRRLVRAGTIALAALVLSLAWALPALAQVDDRDGFDGDELFVPLVLLGVGAVLAWTALRARRGTGAPGS
jgi:hypothetical protein